MRFIIISTFCLTSLLQVQKTSCQSWIACTDYAEYNGQEYLHSKCQGWPRDAAKYSLKSRQFGEDTGYISRPTDIKPCLPARNDVAAYDGNHPMAVYYAGQTVVIAHPTKGHSNDNRCGSRDEPDLGSSVYGYPSSETAEDDPSFGDFTSTENLLQDFGSSPYGPGASDQDLSTYPKLGFQNAPGYCQNKDKALATNNFTIPNYWQPGRYSFIWMWSHTSFDDQYSTCWEADVFASKEEADEAKANEATPSPDSETLPTTEETTTSVKTTRRSTVGPVTSKATPPVNQRTTRPPKASTTVPAEDPITTTLKTTRLTSPKTIRTSIRTSPTSRVSTVRTTTMKEEPEEDGETTELPVPENDEDCFAWLPQTQEAGIRYTQDWFTGANGEIDMPSDADHNYVWIRFPMVVSSFTIWGAEITSDADMHAKGIYTVEQKDPYNRQPKIGFSLQINGDHSMPQCRLLANLIQTKVVYKGRPTQAGGLTISPDENDDCHAWQDKPKATGLRYTQNWFTGANGEIDMPSDADNNYVWLKFPMVVAEFKVWGAEVTSSEDQRRQGIFTLEQRDPYYRPSKAGFGVKFNSDNTRPECPVLDKFIETRIVRKNAVARLRMSGK